MIASALFVLAAIFFIIGWGLRPRKTVMKNQTFAAGVETFQMGNVEGGTHTVPVEE